MDCNRKIFIRSQKINNKKLILDNTWFQDSLPKLKNKIDCYTILENVSFLWKISGIFPVVVIGSNETKKCTFSWLLAIYNFVLVLICIGVFIKGFYDYEAKVNFSVSITAVTQVFQGFSAIISMVIMFYTWLYYRKEFKDAIDFLAFQDTILLKIGCRINYERIEYIIKGYVYGTLVVMGLIFSFCFYASLQIYRQFERDYTFNDVLSWFIWTLPRFLQMYSTTIFVTLVLFLANHFSALNKQLKIIIHRANSANSKVIENSDSITKHIELIAKVHYNLCKISKFLNHKFNGGLIIIVTTAFPTLSASFYFMFVKIQSDDATDYLRVCIYISWQLTYAFPIIAIVVACNLTTNEATYTGLLIHEIDIEKTDTELYKIIRSFSLQLHHQKIEFSGARLFPLNSKLLQSIIAHVTTSLVILIQFQPTITD